MNKAGLSSILVATMRLAVAGMAEAQQPGKVHRIGFVSARADPTPTTPDSSADALRQGLRNLGYIEGKDIVVEYRYFAGKVDRIPSLVAELLQLKLDVLVSVNTLAIRAFKQETKTIPIVVVIMTIRANGIDISRPWSARRTTGSHQR
jgi:putative ABC transport system substrate-binding protein